MATYLRIDEQFLDPDTRVLSKNELGHVAGEDVFNLSRNRVFITVSKKNTSSGVQTTIHVTFYDSGDKCVEASVHGNVEGANLHLHGDFSKDFTDVSVSGELTLSAD